MTINVKYKERMLTFDKMPSLDQIQKRYEALYGAIPRLPEQPHYPLLPVQEQIWFFDQLHPGNAVYNIVQLYALDGPLHLFALQHALQAIVDRHATLRTTFQKREGAPVQVVAARLELPCQIIDASALEEHLRLARREAIIEQELNTGFDLASGPLLRVTLLKESAERHVLFLTVHHIIFDGWSVNVFLQEISELYQAYRHGLPATLPPLPVQFTDYVQWYIERLQKGDRDEQKNYWLEQLQGELPQLDLIPDFVRPPVQSFTGQEQNVTLSPQVTLKLHGLSRHMNATLNTLCLAAVCALLKRYTGQEDLVIGTPVAARTKGALEGMLGHFVNMLPLRFQMSGNSSFAELIEQVKEKLVQALQRQEYPFKLLVEQLNPERDMSRAPIFQTVMTYAKMPTTMRMGDITLSALPITTKTAKFEIGFGFVQQDDTLQIHIDYCTELYSAQTIARLLKHLEQLLISITEDVKAPLDRLQMLSPTEQYELIEGVNQTEKALPTEVCIHQLVEKQAALYPHKTALKFHQEEVAYAELNARANQLARWLRQHGVGADTIVVLLCEQGIEIIVGMLGVLKAGGAYMPLDPSYPVQRLLYMIEDSHAPLVLTQSHLSSLLTDYQGQCLALDSAWEVVAQEAQENVYPTITGEHLLNVLYTSGSTGKPKGVALSHRGAIRLVHQANFAAMDSSEVVLQLSPLNFDGATFEIWGTLCNGGTLVIIKKEIVLAPKELSAEIYRHGVTTLLVTTPLLNRLIEDAPEAVTPLRRVIFGGEIISKPHIKKALDYCQPGTLIHTYGPTENSFTSCYFPIHGVDDTAWTIPIGRPVSHTQLYVLDHHLAPVPYGVVGEIYLSGLGLARGYLNDPEKTAQVFLPHPCAKEAGMRLYKTGDRGRRLKDGSVEFFNRNDNQVKIRSQRVELGEVESILRRSALLRECFVTTIAAENGDKQLLAYFIPATAPSTPDENEIRILDWSAHNIQQLRAFLKQELPAYMTPRYLVPLNNLPLNANGKVNRRALPVPPREMRQDTPYQAPQTHSEQIVAEIWKDVLGLEQVGLDDNFFDIGGHSLLVVKVFEALRAKLDVQLRLIDLFQYVTVRSLAQAIDPEPPGAASEVARTTLPLETTRGTAVAIIGMALRFPKANTLYEFWQNLRSGRECISYIADDELEPAPFHQDPLLAQNIVRAGGFIDHPFLFDPEFFQMSEREAEYTDPQHRLFLECVWEAIENAGYHPAAIDAPVSLYAGCAPTTYLSQWRNHLSALDGFQQDLISQPTFLPTRVSYKLDLTGESMYIDTACSTALVAVHMACQSLLLGHSDYALAGSASLRFPQKTGYAYEPGLILSPDGHCRTFDKDAQGTVEGNGVGVVFLKRLSDALHDRDPIYAVIKGSAINNDGNTKIGYTAPSLQGQMEVIARAQAAAGVTSDQISYVEAHGTATRLGDPIEVEALTRVFREHTTRKQYCAIGSVKTNVGHLGSAAGLAGLIKTVLALKYKELPPSLHFNEPNPEIDFAHSPFYVCHRLQPWQPQKERRLAGVSSFGIGGTNAHMIVEEAPDAKEEGEGRER